MTEKATMKLAFATIIRGDERWCAELGLDPPPVYDQPNRRRRTTERTAA
jgi:hypothetical protein